MSLLLTGLLLLGAIGLFLALPGGRINAARVGWVALAAAAGTFVAVLVQVAGAAAGIGWFGGFALVGLFAALRVITHPRPVYSALYFVLLIVAVTGLLVLAEANFLAAALVIVYAGAILVTYIFVIMLAQQARPAPYDTKSREPFWGCLTGFALLALLAWRLLPLGEPVGAAAVLPAAADNVAAVGTRLLTEYIIAIQLAGLLLLAALVGAIAIARRQGTTTADTEGDAPC